VSYPNPGSPNIAVLGCNDSDGEGLDEFSGHCRYRYIGRKCDQVLYQVVAARKCVALIKLAGSEQLSQMDSTQSIASPKTARSKCMLSVVISESRRIRLRRCIFW
jgi:hypothetical protein